VKPDRRADLELALAAARAAGRVVLAAFGTEQPVTEKGPDQPLTPADLEADRLLKRLLLEERDGYGWLSEETADNPDRLGCSRVWIVDPIDGTRSFIAGRPEFAISIGLAEDGAAVLGVVHNPATGELCWAIRGAGAYRVLDDGAMERLAVRGWMPGETPVLAASRSEIARGELDPFRSRSHLLPVGSTAYKLVKIAAGEADGFLSRGPKSEWDVCAGDLLVREAGGRATDLAGRPLLYNRPNPFVAGILASSGPVHDVLGEVLRTLPPVPRLLEERARHAVPEEDD